MKRAWALAALAMLWTQAAPAAEDPRLVQSREIAARLSEETGARVTRTALRVRNPANAPDAYQHAVLEDFERRLAQNPQLLPEHFDAASDGSARYLKAIVMQPPCLACHRSSLAPEVKAAVAKHYPADQATDFAVGDLRGAFAIEWPSRTETRP